LKRRSDALFPPLLETIFLDIHFDRVEDEDLLKILQRPYQGKGSQRDYNLAKNRLFILDQFIEPSQWANLCHQARNVSENLLRSRREKTRKSPEPVTIASQPTFPSRINQRTEIRNGFERSLIRWYSSSLP
jgi:hypothetical protein